MDAKKREWGEEEGVSEKRKRILTPRRQGRKEAQRRSTKFEA
jgi:hypothetical protein